MHEPKLAEIAEARGYSPQMCERARSSMICMTRRPSYSRASERAMSYWPVGCGARPFPGGAPDDPLADGLIEVVAAVGVPGSQCARSAHPLALDQERLGESQRV
jgi:hypothetical protein